MDRLAQTDPLLALALPSPNCCSHLGNELDDGKSFSLCPCHSTFQLNKPLKTFFFLISKTHSTEKRFKHFFKKLYFGSVL